MRYRIEIIKNGVTAATKDKVADNPQQAVNWLVTRTKIQPFYSVLALNENGDLWGYQVMPKPKGEIKIIKMAYEKEVAYGTTLNNMLAGNVSLKRLVQWN